MSRTHTPDSIKEQIVSTVDSVIERKGGKVTLLRLTRCLCSVGFQFGLRIDLQELFRDLGYGVTHDCTKEGVIKRTWIWARKKKSRVKLVRDARRGNGFYETRRTRS